MIINSFIWLSTILDLILNDIYTATLATLLILLMLLRRSSIVSHKISWNCVEKREREREYCCCMREKTYRTIEVWWKKATRLTWDGLCCFGVRVFVCGRMYSISSHASTSKCEWNCCNNCHILNVFICLPSLSLYQSLYCMWRSQWSGWLPLAPNMNYMNWTFEQTDKKKIYWRETVNPTKRRKIAI